MVFSSIAFLAVFLPLFLAAYYLVKKLAPAYRNTVLFLFSMGFYAYGAFESNTPLYLLVFFLSVIFNYIVGKAIYKTPEENKGKKRAILAFGLVIDFGILFMYKYFDFVFGTSLGLILPLGISFYTFQIGSYLIDVYRGGVPAEKSFINLGAYIMMFPQLIAGPIVRFEDVYKDMRKRKESLPKFIRGVKTFIIGLTFKVVIANQIGNLWREAGTIGYASISVPLAWLAMFAYTFQLYFDFYGYSLMAIGLGRMVGFEFPENFNDPYISVSMTEFWRRWHMTLGTWFREYVYIPLGGSRRGQVRTFFNLFVVWMLTGFWHGADWNFIIWGLLLFIIIAIEKAGLLNVLERNRFFGHVYMILLIPLQWMVFAISDLPKLKVFYGRLIGIGGQNVNAEDWVLQLKSFWWLLLVALILSTGIPKKLYRRFENSWVVYPILAAMLYLVIYLLRMGLNDPFLYFRF